MIKVITDLSQSACSKRFRCVLLGLIEVYLCTSDNQFGFKSKHSSDLCVYTKEYNSVL